MDGLHSFPILYTVICSYSKNSYMTLCYKQTRNHFFHLKFSFDKEERAAQEIPPLYLFVCSKKSKGKRNWFFFSRLFDTQRTLKKSYIHLLLGQFQSSVMLLEMGKCKMEASVLATLRLDTEIKAFYRESICIHSGFQNYFHPLTALESVYL